MANHKKKTICSHPWKWSNCLSVHDIESGEQETDLENDAKIPNGVFGPWLKMIRKLLRGEDPEEKAGGKIDFSNFFYFFIFHAFICWF